MRTRGSHTDRKLDSAIDLPPPLPFRFACTPRIAASPSTFRAHPGLNTSDQGCLRGLPVSPSERADEGLEGEPGLGAASSLVDGAAGQKGRCGLRGVRTRGARGWLGKPSGGMRSGAKARRAGGRKGRWDGGRRAEEGSRQRDGGAADQRKSRRARRRCDGPESAQRRLPTPPSPPARESDVGARRDTSIRPPTRRPPAPPPSRHSTAGPTPRPLGRTADVGFPEPRAVDGRNRLQSVPRLDPFRDASIPTRVVGGCNPRPRFRAGSAREGASDAQRGTGLRGGRLVSNRLAAARCRLHHDAWSVPMERFDRTSRRRARGAEHAPPVSETAGRTGAERVEDGHCVRIRRSAVRRSRSRSVGASNEVCGLRRARLGEVLYAPRRGGSAPVPRAGADAAERGSGVSRGASRITSTPPPLPPRLLPSRSSRPGFPVWPPPTPRSPPATLLAPPGALLRPSPFPPPFYFSSRAPLIFGGARVRKRRASRQGTPAAQPTRRRGGGGGERGGNRGAEGARRVGLEASVGWQEGER